MTEDEAYDIARRWIARSQKVTPTVTGYRCPTCKRLFRGTGGWIKSGAQRHAASCCQPTARERQAVNLINSKLKA